MLAAVLTICAVNLILLGLVLWLTFRPRPDAGASLRLDALKEGQERGETLLRDESARLQLHTEGQSKSVREELGKTLKGVGDSIDRRLEDVRKTVDERLTEIRKGNEGQLEKIRLTVDEKLQTTLEKRIGESFKQVSERLEQVHKGLGEMHELADGVGDLKRVLTNVRTRGTLAEGQVENLLGDILAPGQFEKNVATKEGSRERVEFAVKLPGGRDTSEALWLPIDSKFPKEDYERLIRASQEGDAAGVEKAAKELERTIVVEAKRISSKYINPPRTTDFAIMFLGTEGLYAETLRRDGLVDRLRREHKIIVTGPMIFAALLNAFQMGFKTLAIERRTSEVWKLLGGVKAEFGKFGDSLAAVKEKLEQAQNKIGDAETRTRVIERQLKSVESLPEPDSDPAPIDLALPAATERPPAES